MKRRIRFGIASSLFWFADKYISVQSVKSVCPAEGVWVYTNWHCTLGASFPNFTTSLSLPALWAGLAAGAGNLVSDIHNGTVQWCRLGASKWNVKRKNSNVHYAMISYTGEIRTLCAFYFTSFIFNFRALRLSCNKLGEKRPPASHQV